MSYFSPQFGTCDLELTCTSSAYNFSFMEKKDIRSNKSHIPNIVESRADNYNESMPLNLKCILG